ncbi:hypothetical protein BDY21DRAFT_215679 [Lineolata rhizophorae]|uniref:Zn(2)-C6 fungal-type domain-containing protein n=1 Tax=Lineolata rhizophorae TaxID=578093 RepID=A0A6A6P3A4_9PEZI|nr:hypothetical protein BDY21DRAFT_215679 [Lineolata rhizophorae]
MSPTAFPHISSSNDGNSASSSSNKKRKAQQQPPRQLLSCTKCRERKVKCDRTKPCSACCARGHPKDCHFVVGEEDDYEPIQQSYEIRRLREENLRLKERLRECKPASSEDEKDKLLPKSPLPNSNITEQKAPAGPPAQRQKKFKIQDSPDSMYFGSPGLTNLIDDFAKLQVNSASLSHAIPRGGDIYTPHNGPAFPFATMWPATPEKCIPELLQCLPLHRELFEYLDAFQRKAQSCSFPHAPDDITKKEVERFLSDSVRNAESFPDMLAFIFAAIAQGVQNKIYDQQRSKWADTARNETAKGDIYIAAAMQALRIASYTNSPTLLVVETLVQIGPYLINSGRFLDAYALFGVTIRLAHSIGLHRNPALLNPPPTLRESAIRQSMWWWILHMDTIYSMTLGRPLGISGVGDCPPPEPLTSNRAVLRLNEFVTQLTILARQILSCGRLSNSRIDEFTDKLIVLWDTVPETIQFNEGWLSKGSHIPEWPLNALAAFYYGEIHTYLLLLNRQRQEFAKSSVSPPPSRKASVSSASISTLGSSGAASPMPGSAASYRRGSLPAKPVQPRGRPLVLSCSVALLQPLLYFSEAAPSTLICWTVSQQAFSACMILILDALEAGNLEHIRLVEEAHAVFSDLESAGVNRLAAVAKQKTAYFLDLIHKDTYPQTLANGNVPTDRTYQGNLAADATTAAEMKYPITANPILLPETVMGNSGMHLPEDLNFHSVRLGKFAPLRWNMACCDPASDYLGPHNQQQQQRQHNPGYHVHEPLRSPTASGPRHAGAGAGGNFEYAEHAKGFGGHHRHNQRHQAGSNVHGGYA